MKKQNLLRAKHILLCVNCMLFFIICNLFSYELFAQENIHTTGFYNIYENNKVVTVTNPEVNNGGRHSLFLPQSNFTDNLASYTRWYYQDPSSMGNNIAVSGNSLYSFLGWDLNNKRAAIYDNNSSTPLWIFPTSTSTSTTYAATSDTAGVNAIGAYTNIYLFDKSSNVPFFNFDLTVLPDTGRAGPLDVTSDGNYLIASASRSDTSTFMCFQKNSTTSLWKYRLPKSAYGVKISGNDSLVIVSTYNYFAVINIYTGTARHEGYIQYGTQARYGISGNGNVIATCDLRGYLNVYTWNGSTYNLNWTFQEVPGTYYNWMTSVDISEDSEYIAVGSMVFLTSSSYDGRIRYFKVSSGNTPLWVYSGCEDNVCCVSFSKNGRILSATTWGDLNHLKPDLYIFKTKPDVSTPPSIYTVTTGGSFYSCGTSNDGTTVVACGKAVHARVFGSGGLLYNISVDTSEGPSVVIDPGVEPTGYRLFQNYPNPFNSMTNVKWQMLNAEQVKIIVYDVMGREVDVLVDERLSAGSYSVNFNAGNLTSGVYFYRLTAGNFSETRKMTLLK